MNDTIQEIGRKKKKSAKANRTNKRMVSIAKNEPKKTKKAVGYLAAQDNSVRAGAKIFHDMKNPETKPKAIQAYRAAKKSATAGNDDAKKAVGTVAILAKSEQQEPSIPDSDMQTGATYYQENSQPEVMHDESDSETEYDESSNDSSETYESDSVDGDYMLGGLFTLGFSFKSILKKAVSSVAPLAKTAISVSKFTPYGAAVSAAMSLAPEGIKAGASMLQSAQKGDKSALSKIDQIKSLAKNGSAQGEAALKTLQQAKEFTNKVVQEAKKVVGAPTAMITTPSNVPGTPPLQIFVILPGKAAVREVVETAQKAGSWFWLPKKGLYSEGLTQ